MPFLLDLKGKRRVVLRSKGKDVRDYQSKDYAAEDCQRAL